MLKLREVIVTTTDTWYTGAGWEKGAKEASEVGSYLHAQMSVFAKAIIPSNDLITSTMCRSQYRKETHVRMFTMICHKVPSNIAKRA